MLPATHIDEDGNPRAGSEWRHHSGRLYVVLMVTNLGSTDRGKFPVTVVYQGENGKRWSRPATAFIEDGKFTPEG